MHCIRNMKIILIWFLVDAVVAQDSTEHFSFQPVNNSAGIYFEKISSVVLFNNEWNIVYHINLTSLQEEYNHIENTVEKVDRICNRLLNRLNHQSRNFNNTCGATLQEIKFIMSDIAYFNANWFRSEKRSKRGAFNIVGNVLNSLFGTLSQEDASNYLTHIAELEHTGEETKVIVDKQTTIIQSTAELLKEYNKDNVALYAKLDNQFKLVNMTLQKLRTDESIWQNLETAVETQNLLLFVSLLLTSFKSKQQQFLEALSLLSNKHSQNPIILPPGLFINELLKIQNEIKSKNLKLPLEVDRNTISYFYQIASTRSRMLEDQLLICMSIPLVDPKHYDIIKVTSFPHKMSDSLYSFIIPEYEYFAIDSFRENVISFSNQELENCFDLKYRYEKDLLICMQTSPIFQISSEGNDCGVTLLSHNKIVEKCDIRVSNITSQMWIKLKEVNAWIYIFPKKEVIYMRCNNVPLTEKLLEGTGIIRMKPDCEIKSNVMLIESHSVYNSDVYEEIRSLSTLKFDYNFTDYVEEFNNEIEIKHIDSPHIISFGESDKLKELSNGVRELKNFQRTKMIYHKVQHKYMTLVVSTFVIVITCIVLYCSFKRKFRCMQENEELD